MHKNAKRHQQYYNYSLTNHEIISETTSSNMQKMKYYITWLKNIIQWREH